MSISISVHTEYSHSQQHVFKSILSFKAFLLPLKCIYFYKMDHLACMLLSGLSGDFVAFRGNGKSLNLCLFR